MERSIAGIASCALTVILMLVTSGCAGDGAFLPQPVTPGIAGESASQNDTESQEETVFAIEAEYHEMAAYLELERDRRLRRLDADLAEALENATAEQQLLWQEAYAREVEAAWIDYALKLETVHALKRAEIQVHQP